MPCLPRNRAGLAIGRGNFGAGACAPSARRYRRRRRGDGSMPDWFEQKIAALPKAQQEIWSRLSPAPRLSFVLYGGTAVALYLGQRASVDFDFFRSSPLDKGEVETSFAFMRDAQTMEDLLVTKLKAILDRAEAKDYQDIAAMLSAGISLDRALGAFAKIYGKDPGLVLRAIGYFKDGDLPSLPKTDQNILRAARDGVAEIPDVS